MPRARKTQAQQIAPGETYGEGKQLAEMQAAQPLPDNRAQTEADMMQSALNDAGSIPEQFPPGGFLNQPTSRPNEPVTAGLDIGAGPGSEIMGMPSRRQNQVQQQLATAAQITNNPTIQKMAQNARRPIGQRISRGRPR